MSTVNGEESTIPIDLTNLTKTQRENVCERMSTNQLETACRDVLGWTDELIARSRKLDMKRAIVTAEQPKQQTKPSKLLHDQQQLKIPNEATQSSQFIGSKKEPTSVHRASDVRERSKEMDDSTEELTDKAESLLVQVEILKPYTSGENYIQKAPELLRLITHEINQCSGVLRARFAKIDKELRQLTKADLLATYYINNSASETGHTLSETSTQFKYQIQVRLSSLKNLQARYGELLLKLHSAVQP